MIKIRVGSRGSRLALAQVKEISSLLTKNGAHLDFESIVFRTTGDKDKSTSLTTNPADDFFTDTLDKALLNGDIDIAVHSAKDLPKTLNEGLTIFALTKSVDETDSFVGNISIKKLKKGSKIGTSSTLRKNEIENLNPNITMVDIRGTIDERLALVDAKKLDGVVVATCALKRLGLTRRIKDILPYEATPLQGQLAVVGRRVDTRIENIFSRIDVRKAFGKVTLVGAGPGDPDLITVKGIKALEEADVVFYDYLVDTALLKYAKKAEKIYAGKRKGNKALPQAELSKMLRDKARAGKNVVRLKGGDPLIFGRGADEINYLRSYHIEVKVIPGISSATGIPSIMGIPLTARGVASSVAFVSGHSEEETKASPRPVIVPKADTIVFLMGLTKLNAIVTSLKKSGWGGQAPMIVVSRGTRSDEKIVLGTVETIESLVSKEKIDPPALIIVGEIVKFWQGRNSKRDILYLGTNPKKYAALGQVLHLPMIEIIPVALERSKIKKLKDNLGKYDIIIFTSRFAVSCFMDILQKAGCLLSQLRLMDIVAVGQDTAAQLNAFGLKPKVVPTDETSQGLLRALVGKYKFKGKKILFPRSSLSNPFLKRELIKRGAGVDELTVYKNIKPSKKNVSFEGIDKVIFTSPSTVRNFLKDYRKIPKSWKILSKGLHTQEFLKKAGYQSEVLIHEEVS